VNFLGFVRIINAIGGVDICLPYAVDDPYSGLHMAAGAHHVDGITALEFARDRHSFATSDLARIGNQQQLMATLLSHAASAGTLSDPFRLRRLLSSVTAAIRVDDGFNITGLANELRGIRPGDVSFATVPLANLNYQTSDGQSAVQWDQAAADRLFGQISQDREPAAIARRSAPAHRAHGKHHGRRRRAAPPPSTAAGQQKIAAQAACHPGRQRGA
jgi:anionic cell wall polymer biosynthesis LytR-Cps2A-Psr (LCP) family protein